VEGRPIVVRLPLKFVISGFVYAGAHDVLRRRLESASLQQLVVPALPPGRARPRGRPHVLRKQSRPGRSGLPTFRRAQQQQ